MRETYFCGEENMKPQDRLDAKRYRWLKDHGYANEKNASIAVIGDSRKARVAFRYWCSPADLDALIDGAMIESPNVFNGDKNAKK